MRDRHSRRRVDGRHDGRGFEVGEEVPVMGYPSCYFGGELGQGRGSEAWNAA